MATTRTTERAWISGREVSRLLGIHPLKALELVRERRFTTLVVPGRKYPRVLRHDVEALARASIHPPDRPEIGACLAR